MLLHHPVDRSYFLQFFLQHLPEDRCHAGSQVGRHPAELGLSVSVYDKLEKANFYLEQSIEHADKPLDDRLVLHLASNPLNDGGQWDMAANLLEVTQPSFEIAHC